VKYAVVESGGKQYIARPGELIEVDHMPLEVGKSVKFKNVLMAVDGSSIRIGQPMIKGAVVEGKVAGQIKGRKILVFKYKPKIRYRRKQGHRQRYTQVSIQKITLPAEQAEAAPAAAAKKPAAKKTTAKKAAPAKKKPAATASKKKPTTKASTKKTADGKAKKPAAKKPSSKPAAKKTTSSKKTDEK
jgi:large subunit ribosomal protein L21